MRCARLKSHIQTHEMRASSLRAGVAEVPAPVLDGLAEIAARAEALAAAAEDKLNAA